MSGKIEISEDLLTSTILKLEQIDFHWHSDDPEDELRALLVALLKDGKSEVSNVNPDRS